MKFTININQREARMVSAELDIVDMAIFDFLKDFAQSPECIKMQSDGVTYYMFSWKLICSQLPIIGITTQRGIQKRLEKLSTHDILKSHPNIEQIQRPFYTFGSNYKRLLFATNENSHPRTDVHGPTNNGSPEPRTTVHPPMNGRSCYNNITDNTIREKNITKKDAPVSVDEILNLPLPFVATEFATAWREWVEYRQALPEKKKHMTMRSAAKDLKFLGRRDLFTAIEMIDTAIRRSWYGLYELDKPQYTNGRKNNGNDGGGTAEQFAARVAEYRKLDGGDA